MVAFICTGHLFAQYGINPNVNPANPLPVSYLASHYQLKGDIKSEKVPGEFGYEYIFDSKGRLLQNNSDLFGDISYFYDTSGNLMKSVSSTDFGDVTELYSVDSKGRVTGWRYSDGSAIWSYIYNAKGLWVETKNVLTNETTGKKYYDSQDRIIKEETYKEGQVSYLVNYAYANVNGAIQVTKTSKSFPDGKEYAFTDYYKNGENLFSCSNCTFDLDDAGNWYYKKDATGKVISSRELTYHSGKTSGVVGNIKPNSPSNPNTPVTNPDCISGDCNNGYGKKKYDNGTYTGFFSNGSRNGYGMYQWTDAGKYIGFWSNNNMEGYGCYFGSNKDYVGEFKNGSMTGLGSTREVAENKWSYGVNDNYVLTEKYDFFDNKVTEGCIAGDCVNKYGRYKWANGDVYTGYFKNGRMYMGVYKFASGDTYEGMFNTQNQFHGQGRYFYADKSYYAGEWRNGAQQGLGYFHDPAFNVKAGIWENGNLSKSYQ